jgi:hypothetical protein
MRPRLWAFLTFVVVSPIVGFVFWWQQDWCFYVDMTAGGRGMIPKFVLTPLEQFVVSSFVGAVVGGVAAAAAFAASVLVGRAGRCKG